ncbi:sulfite exporter TauE/SafE family protein [Intrasporangium sp.]|uniref:sulfite exporter TauE/SafE family protein n=1 Tax=Intrasporangium sp. TaxID=1925024 RepID=UPI00293A41F1|nr:sulfite exporter TauE/SafE family protein [Intrasporangium sp.]MDV3221640.1 sulfite exporter TauE/SafE family protein [Intrasporangium sp.]
MAAPLLALAAFLSIFIGVAVGLLGGGGSILTTPLLVYVLDFEAKQAITASLFLVAVTSMFGLIQHARARRVQWRTGVIFGVAGMVGAFIGGQLGAHLPGSLLLGAFAVMMGVTAVAMIRGRQKTSSRHANGLPLFRILLDGFLVGLVTGLVGAGGGFLVVPALALLGGLPMGVAVATSLLVISMKAVAGFVGYAFKFGVDGQFIQANPETQIDWSVTLLVTGFAIVGALIGSRVVGRIHPDRLRTGFGWFVLVMAVFMLSQEAGPTVVDYASGGWLNLLLVIVGGVAIVALFTWLIRRGPGTPPAPAEIELEAELAAESGADAAPNGSSDAAPESAGEASPEQPARR